jgi:hypothetical protein
MEEKDITLVLDEIDFFHQDRKNKNQAVSLPNNYST